MTTFALIHGGAHGGWCWELLVPELEAHGHNAVTPDLPFEEDAGAKVWAETVIGALDEAGAGDDVIVVGHSLGGIGRARHRVHAAGAPDGVPRRDGAGAGAGLRGLSRGEP